MRGSGRKKALGVTAGRAASGPSSSKFSLNAISIFRVNAGMLSGNMHVYIRSVTYKFLLMLIAGFAVVAAGVPGVVYSSTSDNQAIDGRVNLKSNLRFSHRSHADARIRCEACHRNKEAPPEATTGLPPGWAPLKFTRIASTPVDVIDESTAKSAGYAFGSGNSGLNEKSGVASSVNLFGRPPEKLCLRCHFHSKSKSDCGLCHLGKPLATERVRVRIGFGATFNHDQHVKIDCIECHRKIEKWESLDGVMQETSMTSCLRCHTGVKVRKTCTLCHEKTPRPADHGRKYERKHGIAWRSDPQSCRPCHEDSSCLTCHARKPRDHTLAWIARRHGISAEADPDRCAVCHSTKDVCRRCHP
ncbi:MAG: cytochrome c3 family protein [Candidatus Riflebacteria bacterium]|nr:cytochrome c3 family protein [Candidatus Riflebacteria bacterium]